MTRFTMPAGEYYIGDLCYVMEPEWEEFCALTINGNKVIDGAFTLKDGRSFLFFNTLYGDGVYSDNYGREYGVDAGLIGAILVDNISEEEKKELDLGHVVTFETPWEAMCIKTNGQMAFGNVVIDTGYEEDYND